MCWLGKDVNHGAVDVGASTGKFSAPSPWTGIQTKEESLEEGGK